MTDFLRIDVMLQDIHIYAETKWPSDIAMLSVNLAIAFNSIDRYDRLNACSGRRLFMSNADVKSITQLLLAVRDDRDQTAFAEFYQRTAAKLNGYLQNNGIPSAQSEEILQEVYVKIWHKASLFDPSRAASWAWIYRITKNQMIDHLRKEKMPLPEDIDMTADHVPDASEYVESDRDFQKLTTALQKLKPEERALIKEAFLLEKSHVEIQTETNIPLGTIKSRIRSGLEKLRYEMKVNSA